MRKNSLWALAAIVAATLTASAPAKASTVTDVFSGTLGGYAVSGSFTLDVTGGTATDGTGTFTGFGLVDVPMVLITTSTSGNETGGGVSYPVGFRANDGADLFGADQNYPIDTAPGGLVTGNGGLLFDVDTSLASFGNFPLFGVALGSNGGVFVGDVGNTNYYLERGSLDVSETPLPGALPLFAGGLGVIGLLTRRRKRSSSPSALDA